MGTSTLKTGQVYLLQAGSIDKMKMKMKLTVDSEIGHRNSASLGYDIISFNSYVTNIILRIVLH